MPDSMTRPADWVDALCVRHVALTDARFCRPLTVAEQLEWQRVQSLLDAWEAWDLGGHVTLLRLRLALSRAAVSP